MFRGAIVLLSLLANGQADKSPMPLPVNDIEFLFRQIPRIEPAKIADVNAPRKYIPFPIDGNPEQRLADFLRSKDGQAFQEKLLDVFKNPQSLADFVKTYGDDSRFKELIERFGDGKQTGNFDPAKFKVAFDKLMERDPEMVVRMLKKLQDPDGFLGKPFDLNSNKTDDIQLPKLDDLVGDDELPWDERLSEWIVDFLKRDEVRNDLLEALENTPDLQKAVEGLLDSLHADGAGNWSPKLPDFQPGKWDLKPPAMPFKLEGLPKLPAISMPQLPRLNLPMPRLGGFRMPRNPFAGGFGLNGRPSVSGDGNWLYLIFAVVAIALTGWLLRKVRWTKRGDEGDVAAFLANLPNAITTRTQLRLAFDAFAVARLGRRALPWNHRQVARQLGGAPAAKMAADAFAHLYELARYTPGDDRLTPAEQTAVRDSLAALTGGAK